MDKGDNKNGDNEQCEYGSEKIFHFGIALITIYWIPFGANSCGIIWLWVDGWRLTVDGWRFDLNSQLSTHN
jgi:hypothetical protein